MWWGYDYYDQPPIAETVRIRVYHASGPAGLPGTIAAEHIASNPTKVATGRQVAINFGPDEYRYELDLASAFELDANEHYWLEIAQLDDPAHAFGWLLSVPPVLDGLALNSPSFGGWFAVTNGPDLAFQLWSIPEPATLGLVDVGAMLARRRGRR